MCVESDCAMIIAPLMYNQKEFGFTLQTVRIWGRCSQDNWWIGKAVSID